MKLTVSKNDLLSKISIVGKVIKKNITLPVLDNFYCEVVGSNKLIIKASDTESEVTADVEVVADETFRFLLPAKIILESLKTIPEQPITIEVLTSMIKISYMGGQFEIPVFTTDEFPMMSFDYTAKSFPIDSDDLILGLKKTQNFSMNDDMRQNLSSIFVEIKDKKLSFVSTNMHTLALVSKNIDSENDNFLLHRNIISILSLILQKEGSATVSISNKNIQIQTQNFQIITRLVDAKYPNYNAVIPKNSLKIRLNTSELKNSLQRVSNFSNQSTRLVILEIKNNEMKVLCEDTDYSMSAEENLKLEESNINKNFRIGFKIDFLLSEVSEIKTDTICLEFSEPHTATLITPESNDVYSLLYLIMPVVIN